MVLIVSIDTFVNKEKRWLESMEFGCAGVAMCGKIQATFPAQLVDFIAGNYLMLFSKSACPQFDSVSRHLKKKI